MIVKQNSQASFAENFRIVVERHGDGGSRAMGHDDGGKWLGSLWTIKSASQQRVL
jgi:hypothetical protein